MFITLRGSRRAYNNSTRKSNPFSINALSFFAQQELGNYPHGDTISNYLKNVTESDISDLTQKMTNRLIRMKALDKYRLNGYLLVAVDGTHQVTFKERHCKHCLTQNKNGIITYYHSLLELKIVTETGLVLSLCTEFIENESENVSKQDCELNAFYRVSSRLKEMFPKLKICLLMDSLYMSQQLFSICKDYNWKYIINFKRGSMPSKFAEFEELKILEPENKHFRRKGNISQTFHFVNKIEHESHYFDVVECEEKKKTSNGEIKRKYFVWATNFNITKENVANIGNKGGRLRWKIENEGFNFQKNSGFNLEHLYSKTLDTEKIYYLLMQVAHTIFQLMTFGNLVGNLIEVYGSIKHFAECLRDDFRHCSKVDLAFSITIKVQIRLDSS